MQNTGQICILLSMNVRVKRQPNKHACIHTPVGIDHSRRSQGKQMITSKFSVTFHDDLLSVSKPRRLINTCTPVECLIIWLNTKTKEAKLIVIHGSSDG